MEKLNEGDVFELVLDYLSTKGFTETERTLRKEKVIGSPQTHGKSSSGASESAYVKDNIPIASAVVCKSPLTFLPIASVLTVLLAILITILHVPHTAGSRLEGLLEKSHVAHMFGNKANKRRRTNLDAALLDDEKASAPAAAAAADEPEQAAPTMSMATQITSYNPCKDDPYGASSMPIYQVSTFAQPSATTFGEYDYSRSGNPTRAALEKQICELEGGHRGFAFSSGMAALSAVTRL
eukprot:7394-Heterococcus_DN1.PRE.2